LIVSTLVYVIEGFIIPFIYCNISDYLTSLSSSSLTVYATTFSYETSFSNTFLLVVFIELSL